MILQASQNYGRNRQYYLIFASDFNCKVWNVGCKVCNVYCKLWNIDCKV